MMGLISCTSRPGQNDRGVKDRGCHGASKHSGEVDECQPAEPVHHLQGDAQGQLDTHIDRQV